MNLPSLREALNALVGLFGELSLTTRVILAGYALYVVGFWTFAVAPGQIAFEHATTVTVDGELGRATSMVRADDRYLLVDLGATEDRPAAIALVDLDVGIEHDAIVSLIPQVGQARSGTVYDDELYALTETAEGRNVVSISLDDGSHAVAPVDPRALWIFSDTTAMGHGLMDFLVEGDIAATPAVVSGNRALVRMGASDGQLAEDGTWAVPPSATPDDFVIVNAENMEPLQRIDTVRLDYIGPAPGRSAFLYVAQGFPGFVVCADDGSCKDTSVHVRTETHPIVALDHRHDIARIAVCTPVELYLYEGEPGEDEVIYLGHTALRAPCHSLAIVDGQTVWVTTSGGPARLVRFFAEGEP